MKSINAVAIISVLAIIVSAIMYLSINSRMDSVAAVGSSDAAVTSHDQQLYDRLIRFGQVAFDRGQFAEAKHFFQKAITVDPGNTLAWKRYNMALIALISDRVQTDPGFLPEFSSGPGVSDTPRQMSTETADDDDGC